MSLYTEPLSGKSPQHYNKGGGQGQQQTQTSPQHYTRDHARSVAELKAALQNMAVVVGQQQARIAELEAANASLSLQVQQLSGGSGSAGRATGAAGLPSPTSHARF
jgi:hypothetical protein